MGQIFSAWFWLGNWWTRPPYIQEQAHLKAELAQNPAVVPKEEYEKLAEYCKNAKGALMVAEKNSTDAQGNLFAYIKQFGGIERVNSGNTHLRVLTSRYAMAHKRVNEAFISWEQQVTGLHKLEQLQQTLLTDHVTSLQHMVIQSALTSSGLVSKNGDATDDTLLNLFADKREKLLQNSDMIQDLTEETRPESAEHIPESLLQS